jgi:hypothetical protein
MIASRHWSAMGLLLAFAMSASWAENCADIERRIEARVSSLAVAADELSAFRGLGEMALTGLGDCPDSARLWYLSARSAEVVDVLFAGAEFSAYGGAKKIALDAAAHAPHSAPIATILAREDGTVASARRAHDMDPDYRPARRALALALAKENSFDEALQLLNLRDPSSADRIAHARVLLAAHRARDAANEAKKALNHPLTESVEPTPYSEIIRDGHETLGFSLLAEGRKKDALRALRLAAAAGSYAAQTELDKQGRQK